MGRRRWTFAATVVAAALAPPSAAHAAAADPASLAFGNVRVGTTSPQQTTTITRATLDVSFGPPAISGPGFAIASDGCTPSPAPLGTCTISVTFAPATTGPATGTLTVPGTTADAVVSLSGTGTLPQAALAPPSLAFDARQTDQPPSAQQFFTLANPGNEALAVSGISATGDTGDFFANQTGGICTPPFSIPAGGSCQYAVIFKPSAAGARAMTISFAHNAPGGSSSITVTGTGVAPPPRTPSAPAPPPTVIIPGGGSTVTGAPRIAIASPKRNASVTRFKRVRKKRKLVTVAKAFTVKGTASDTDGLARVEVALVRGARAPSSPKFKRAKLDDFAWSYSVSAREKLKKGTYTLVARATDVTGVRSAVVAVTFKLK